MKQILLFLFLVVAFVFSGLSQGLELKDKAGNDITNLSLTVHGSPGASVIKAEVFLHNATEETIDVWVRKIEEEIIPNTFNTFCWGNHCYTNTVFESEAGLSLDAETTSSSTDFYGEYYPEGNSGTTVIVYEFFSRNASFETVSVTVSYAADATSVSGPRQNPARISDPRPNPARDFTLFDYQLPPDTRSARIVVRNLTGSSVMEVPLDPAGSRLRLETSNLNIGIYLYSFVVNDQVILTKKLVVSR
jgi:hypothetical protein